MCDQNRTGSEGWDVEQDDGFSFGVWSVAKVKAVTVGTETADDMGTRGCVNGLALGAGRDFAVVADADAGLLTPDVGPPGTRRDGTDDGAFFGEGLLVGGVRGLPEFAVDFMLVGVGEEWIEQLIGAGEFDDVVGGHERDQTFLPVVVAAFDFAFGLRSWGIEEFDPVEVEGLTELGEGIGIVGVKEGVVVHIESQWQAVGLKDAGEEVEVGQQGFGAIAARTGVQARGIVENVQEDLFFGVTGQPGVGCGVVLPERAVIAGLPAFDGFGRGLVAGVGSKLVFAGPAPDAGAVGFEVQAAVEFAGDSAVGTGRFGGKEFGGQGDGFGGPLGRVVAAGQTGGPCLSVARGAGSEVICVEFVETGLGQSQFDGGGAGADLAGAVTVEEMADERCRQTMDQL